MRLPVQASPIYRAFMREVVSREWAPADVASDAASASKAKGKAQSKRARKSASEKSCLIRLTTFAGSRRRAS
jgi:hypothetical protein